MALCGVACIENDYTVISVKHAKTIDVDWDPFWDANGFLRFNARARVSLIAPDPIFYRRIQVGIIQDFDALVGSDLLGTWTKPARSITSASLLARGGMAT